MAHSQNVKRLFCKLVANAQTTNDIIPLLRLIPVEAIKDAVLGVVRGLDTNTANEMKYKCLSLTDIVPDDITQHITSFSDSLNMKYINKAFNRAFNRCRTLELKRRDEVIRKHEFNPIVKYEAHNAKWIIHPTRTHLSRDEIAKGFRGPINRLKDLVDDVQSGDKLLFYDGKYILTHKSEFRLLSAYDLQLIGVDSFNKVSIQIKNAGNGKLLDLYDGNNLYLKNVKLLYAAHSFRIESRSSVFMENCIVDLAYRSFIDVKDTATFHAKRCLFVGKNREFNENPIKIEWGSNVNIVGCMFAHHNKSCIRLWKDPDRYQYDYDDHGTVLKCVGNIFKDNCGYPIAMDEKTPLKTKQALKSVIRHNILKGYNAVNVNDTVDTANKIYTIKKIYY
eukprot:121755_1